MLYYYIIRHQPLCVVGISPDAIIVFVFFITEASILLFWLLFYLSRVSFLFRPLGSVKEGISIESFCCSCFRMRIFNEGRNVFHLETVIRKEKETKEV